MSVVAVEKVPVVPSSEWKVARDLLDKDIEEIIDKEISMCKLENFPYSTKNPVGILNHISRSIFRVTEARGFTLLYRKNMGYRAFKFYAVKDGSDQYVPYILFDVEAYKKALKELEKEPVYNGTEYLYGKSTEDK